MADYNSSLPVRTEADADERLQSKIVDFTTPSQGMTVDSDGLAHVEMHGNNPAGGDEVLRTSELGHAAVDGVYDGTNNTDPSNVGLVAHTRNATPGDAQQAIRVTGITNSTRHALDIALHDETGAPFSSTNPLPVTMLESEGAEINNYNTAAAVAAAATSNHDYTVSGGVTLQLTQITAAASGKAKIEVQIETAAASGTFNTRFVQFNSTANPNMQISLREPIAVVTGAKVRVIRTNLDNQAQDLYSTISGHEVA